MREVTIGYDRTTLRPTIDTAAATRRVRQLAKARSFDGLIERARLLEALGNLSAAATCAAQAVMAARAGGGREATALARLVRASIVDAAGNHDDAVLECSRVIEEARSADWVPLWTRALQQRGVAHFALGQWSAAAADFARAHSLRQESDAPNDLVQESELAMLIARDRADVSQVRSHVPRAQHPLFGK